VKIDDHTRDILSPSEPMAHLAWATMPPDVIPTPFAQWTDACRDEGGAQGIAMGWYIVIAGDTKQGKTLLALQCAVEALKSGRQVGFLNLEMSIPQLRIRLYSQLTGVPAYKLEPGKNFDPHAAKWVSDAIAEAQRQRTARFLVNEDPAISLTDMIALMESWHRDYGCEVYVVDYMQLVESDSQDGIAGETREISKALRHFKRRTNTVVYAISQFNNEGGNDTTRSPHAGSLYGGRRIAQDSDQTLLLDHSRIDRSIPGKARTWLHLAYNRHGPAVEIPVEWEWDTLTARAAGPDEEEFWPQHDTQQRRKK